MPQLLPWIDETKLNYGGLALNPSAVDYLRDKLDKVDWLLLSTCSYAIDLLANNQDKVVYSNLSYNRNIFI